MKKQLVIRVEPYGKEVTGSKEETVLEILRKQFYGRDGQPSFRGCWRGGCAFCKVELLEGEVNHNEIYSRTALADEEREKNFILTCQSQPLSDLIIRFLEKEDPISRLIRLKSETIK
ncbi:CDP-4-dehydro-6-deoxyglucose reductase [Anoxybacillus vitaminiphilus]|uniref:CDP-4-dehydro-6-deoxyglucose reductase n=1 Tax=Paranoxybacillus vitaminiphilus TaxID=581036 RepID=A0A327Y1R5_9BACL|nr:2Fe-2S iron-sulfur cluster-binding protein [Anoxybacillus vitaminiphilus]RAK14953.1 CDP-4-dehydro-6-deoxyglucose reductase [Anoxybacillus vitaminiphilus]